MNKKEFAPIVIIVFVAVVITVGVISYPKPNNSTTSIQSSGPLYTPLNTSSSFNIPYPVSWFLSSSQSDYGLEGVLINANPGSSTITLRLKVSGRTNVANRYIIDSHLSMLIDKSGNFSGPISSPRVADLLQAFDRDFIFAIPADWGRKFVFLVTSPNSDDPGVNYHAPDIYFIVTEKDDGSISVQKESDNTNGYIILYSTTSTFTYTPRGRNGCPVVPLSLSFVSPKAGDTVSGTIKVVVSASNSYIITSIDFMKDNNGIIGAATSSPYAVAWDTTKDFNGPHTLWAFGNVPTGCASVNIPVNVISDIPAPPPPPYHPCPPPGCLE